MSRLKPLLFVIGLSLVSAVGLRLLLGRMTASMQPASPQIPTPDSTDLARRLVGCGHLQFVFDSLGYRTGQWPAEVDSSLAVARVDALVDARDGRLTAGDGAVEIGGYVIRRDTVYLTLGPVPGGLRARLGAVGDSLGGRLERSVARGAPFVIGRLFLATPRPGSIGCGRS